MCLETNRGLKRCSDLQLTVTLPVEEKNNMDYTVQYVLGLAETETNLQYMVTVTLCSHH